MQKIPIEKCQYLISKREKLGLNHCDDSTAFIEYSNNIEDVYKNIEKYNLGKKRKELIVFDDRIADMNDNKLNPLKTELFIELF